MIAQTLSLTILIFLLTNMLLPYRLLTCELARNDCTNIVMQYRKALEKQEKNCLRVKFLSSCLKADVVPRFLKFRIPNNGTFDNKSVLEFQLNLLRKELYGAKTDLETSNGKLETKRSVVKERIGEAILPSVALHTRLWCRNIRRKIKSGHDKKLLNLSEEQQRLLFNVKNTVVLHGLEEQPPNYVMETLSLGPKNAVLEKFNPHDVLVELDDVLRHCKDNGVTEDVISDINMKTIGYIKKCKKQKSSRNVAATKRYLKEKKLLAIPFDKGVGICVMKKEDNEGKLEEILELPQFEKWIAFSCNEDQSGGKISELNMVQ